MHYNSIRTAQQFIAFGSEYIYPLKPTKKGISIVTTNRQLEAGGISFFLFNRLIA